MNRVFCLIPAWVLISAMLILPLVLVFVISLMQAGPYGGISWQFGNDSYKGLLFATDFTGASTLDWSYAIVLLRSVFIAGCTTFFCLCIGFPVAYFISRRSPRHRNLLVLLIALPFWSDLLVRIYAWVLILSEDGLLHSALQGIGLPWLYRDILFTNSALVLGMTYNYLPLMVLPLYASLEKIDGRLIEAAADLYARRGARLGRIIIGLSMPGIVAGCLLVFITAIGDFITPTLMGGGRNMLLSNLVALQFSGGQNWPFGAAIAMLILSLVSLAGGLQWWLTRRRGMKAADAKAAHA